MLHIFKKSDYNILFSMKWLICYNFLSTILSVIRLRSRARRTETHTHTHTHTHAWPCTIRKRKKTRRAINQGSTLFVAIICLERVRDKGQRSRGARASLIISRGFAILIFEGRSSENASGRTQSS